jgi:tetratricopeptide (TPR) repeat protein
MHAMGDGTEALSHLDQAEELLSQVGNDLECAVCAADKAGVLHGLVGDQAAAEKQLSRAIEIYEDLGHASGMGVCWNGIAEMHRHRGDLAAADAAYLTAQTHMVRGGQRAIVPAINRGMIRLHRDDHAEAQSIFSESLAIVEGTGQEVLEAHCHLGLLACMAHSREWLRFDHHLQSATEILTRTGAASRDLAWPAERGGDRAVAEGERPRAEAAWQIAMEQWRRVGDSDLASRLAVRLGKKDG